MRNSTRSRMTVLPVAAYNTHFAIRGSNVTACAVDVKAAGTLTVLDSEENVVSYVFAGPAYDGKGEQIVTHFPFRLELDMIEVLDNSSTKIGSVDPTDIALANLTFLHAD